jgi:hypothetical protein
MNFLGNYIQQSQEQTLWCWAAVACSVSDYLGRPQWAQCSLAQEVLERQGCCVRPSSCNAMGSLERALETTESLGESRYSVVELEAIQRQIDVGLPVCIRIQRQDGSAHVMVIVGYDDGVGSDCQLRILDPWPGSDSDDVPYGVLRDSFYSGGRWSDTYFTA